MIMFCYFDRPQLEHTCLSRFFCRFLFIFFFASLFCSHSTSSLHKNKRSSFFVAATAQNGLSHLSSFLLTSSPHKLSSLLYILIFVSLSSSFPPSDTISLGPSLLNYFIRLYSRHGSHIVVAIL